MKKLTDQEQKLLNELNEDLSNSFPEVEPDDLETYNQNEVDDYREE